MNNDEDDNENDDDDKLNESADMDASVALKKSDGEEKYDPLEADAAESEDDDNREAEEDAKETMTGNANAQESKKTSVDEAWADINNDTDVEPGNLIDDVDEKEHTDHEKSIPKVDRNHSPQAKPSSRGRAGYTRIRGGPRARRARR